MADGYIIVDDIMEAKDAALGHRIADIWEDVDAGVTFLLDDGTRIRCRAEGFEGTHVLEVDRGDAA